MSLHTFEVQVATRQHKGKHEIRPENSVVSQIRNNASKRARKMPARKPHASFVSEAGCFDRTQTRTVGASSYQNCGLIFLIAIASCTSNIPQNDIGRYFGPSILSFVVSSVGLLDRARSWVEHDSIEDGDAGDQREQLESHGLYHISSTS